MRINYVIPLIMGGAFLIIGLVLPALLPDISLVLKWGLLAGGLILLIAAYFIARAGSRESLSRGGQGGKAIATGESAEAVGGAGGKSNGGIGGNGGNARATGKGSRAKGGAGGTG